MAEIISEEIKAFFFFKTNNYFKKMGIMHIVLVCLES